jgi:uncharacterized membrane protein YfbV (UPF0208 family)
MANPVEIAKTRPAETAMPVTTVFAILISKAIGVEDTDTIAYIAIALSFVPAIVTWIVDLRRNESHGTTQLPSNGESS